MLAVARCAFSEENQRLADIESLLHLVARCAGRLASLQSVDEGVAKLVKTLKATGQYDNTVIVFTSDNGWIAGQHRIPGDKFLPYDESLKVPLIVRGPGIPQGQKVRGQVSNIDFAPTLLDLANARPGRAMDGLSLLPTIADPDQVPQRALGIEAPAPLFAGAIPANAWDRPYEGVRTDRWKLIHFWEQPEEWELYDLQSDPDETHNLAGDRRHAPVLRQLRERLEQLRAELGDEDAPGPPPVAAPCGDGVNTGYGPPRRGG